MHPASMGRKRILLLDSALHTGGGERVLAHLARNLDPQSFDVSVGHLMRRGSIGDELAREGVKVVGVDRDGRPFFRYFSFRALGRLLREQRIDLIHTHTHYALFDSSICRLARLGGVKLVHTFHYGNYPHLPWRYRVLEWVGSRAANRLVAVGTEQAKAVRATYGLSENELGVIVNGAELASEPIDEAWRQRLRGSTRVVIGTICTFIEQKGLPDLLRVAVSLRDAGANALFVVVGDGGLRSQIETASRALGLADRVLFAGWKHGASSSMLPLFDIFFQPSHWEAMSMVVIEAMAAGRPVVATDVGDNRHVVVDGVTGYIAPRADIASMTRALTKLVDSPAAREAFGAAGLRRYRERFTVAGMVRAYEQLYRDVLAS